MRSRIARPLVATCLVALTLSLLPLGAAHAAPTTKQLFLSPVPGLTTVWHPAPDATAISRGTTVQLRRPVQGGSSVVWSGAQEISNADGWSTAQVSLGVVGPHVVSVSYTRPDGRRLLDKIVFDVLDVAPADIQLTDLQASVEAAVGEGLGEKAVETLPEESIAQLRQIGEGEYRTSVDREVAFAIQVDPPGFAPLIEWRSNTLNSPPRLGSLGSMTFQKPARHKISAGPLASPLNIVLETYRVEITSHVSGRDLIPEGQPAYFTAVTDPPGYEDEITWGASAPLGFVKPIREEAGNFIVAFENNYTASLVGDAPVERLRVMADNAVFNQFKNCNLERSCSSPKHCKFDDIDNIAFGNSQLRINDRCNLVVGGVGSTGRDGVRQFPLPEDSLAMVTGVACPNFQLSSRGAKGEFIMYGDVPGDKISTLTVENVDDDNLVVNADFSPVGVKNYIVQIMNGQKLVAEFVVPEATVIIPRTDLREVDCRIEPEFHISYEITRPLPIAIKGVEGLWEGNIIWKIGIDPTVTATVQTAIDNFFTNTGPVEMTFQFAGPETQFPHFMEEQP